MNGLINYCIKNKRLSKCLFSTRLKNSLESDNLHNLGDVLNKCLGQLGSLKGMGISSIMELEIYLNKRGFELSVCEKDCSLCKLIINSFLNLKKYGKINIEYITNPCSKCGCSGDVLRVTKKVITVNLSNNKKTKEATKTNYLLKCSNWQCNQKTDPTGTKKAAILKWGATKK